MINLYIRCHCNSDNN